MTSHFTFLFRRTNGNSAAVRADTAAAVGAGGEKGDQADAQGRRSSTRGRERSGRVRTGRRPSICERHSAGDPPEAGRQRIRVRGTGREDDSGGQGGVPDPFAGNSAG